MAIYRLLKEAAFGPDEIARMSAAYEIALRETHLARTDPATETIAKTIIEVTRTGELDPVLICASALKNLGRRSGA